MRGAFEIALPPSLVLGAWRERLLRVFALLSTRTPSFQSRAVGVAQSLISRDMRAAFVAANDADYAEIRERHRNRGDAKRLVSLEKARGQT